MIATVKYQIATYSGEINVRCEEWEESEIVEKRAEALINRRNPGLPFGYRSFKEIHREDD
jgi:hypothetical protein